MNRRQFLAASAALLAAPAAQAAPVGPRPVPLPGTTPDRLARFMGPIFRLNVNDVQIAYRDFGEGPSLLFLTERSTSMSWWQAELMQSLARARRVITMDYRGVGYSTDNLATEMTVATLASDAAGLLWGLGIPSASVVGWGLGACVGLTLALNEPRRLERLVLSAGDPGGSHSQAPIPEIESLLSDPKTQAEQLMAVMFSPSAREAKQAFLASLEAMPAERTPETTAARQAHAVRLWRADDRTHERLSSLRLPVLVHYGTRDVITPPANGEWLARHIPEARREAVESGSHACLFEQWPSFAELLESFLGSVR